MLGRRRAEVCRYDAGDGEGAEFIVHMAPEGIEVISMRNDVGMGSSKVTPGVYASKRPNQTPFFRNAAPLETEEVFADVTDGTRTTEVAPLGYSSPQGGASAGSGTSAIPPAAPRIGGGGGGVRATPVVPQ